MFFTKTSSNGDMFPLFSCSFVEGIWSFKLQSDLKQQQFLFNSWLVASMCFRLTDFCLAICSSIFCIIFLPRVCPFRTSWNLCAIICSFVWSPWLDAEQGAPFQVINRWTAPLRNTFGDSRSQIWLGSTPHPGCQWLKVYSKGFRGY